MPEPIFYILVGLTWLTAMAYGLSAFRLLARVRHLKEAGRAADAPDPFTNPLAVFGYIAWLLTGRYAELGDDVASRWTVIARGLFIVALPLILAVFAMGFTQAGVGSQPT